MTKISENIKNARKKLGITQEQLAEKLSVTRQAVSNWEKGNQSRILKPLQKSRKFSISALMNLLTEFRRE